MPLYTSSAQSQWRDSNEKVSRTKFAIPKSVMCKSMRNDSIASAKCTDISEVTAGASYRQDSCAHKSRHGRHSEEIRVWKLGKRLPLLPREFVPVVHDQSLVQIPHVHELQCTKQVR